MSKPNPRLIDTPDTVAIKPIGTVSSKDLTIEDIDMPIGEYLKSLGMGDKPSEAKTDSVYKSRNRTKKLGAPKS